MTIQDLSNRVQSVLPLERGLYWGGEWHHPEGVATLQSFNPSTSELLGEVHVARPQDVDAAVGAARRAFPAWAATPPLDRSRCLREAAARIRANAVDLALLDAADCGNPVKAMVFDAEIAAPLAAGNTVVLKPPEQAPLSTVRLMELLRDLFPPGVASGCGRRRLDRQRSRWQGRDEGSQRHLEAHAARTRWQERENFWARPVCAALEQHARHVAGGELGRVRPDRIDLDAGSDHCAPDGAGGAVGLRLGQRRVVALYRRPLCGYKQSGLGREESKDELFEFTQIKNVNVSMIP
jgi:Aldehyde dehydrogenase family